MDDKKERGEPSPRSNTRPSHFAYQVRQGDDGKGHFNRIGAAFPHKDGQGFNLALSAMPFDGKVTLRTPKERLEAKRDGGRSDRNREEPER